MRALEKADTPSDPVEQTTRAAAPAPRDWPGGERDGVRGAGVRVGQTGCTRRMRGFPIVDSFQGHGQVTFCSVSSRVLL